MMNSFGSTPRILRLFARGEVVEKGSAHFAELLRLFTPEDEPTLTEEGSKEVAQGPHPDWQTEAFRYGSRAVILLHVFKVQTSCGYGVPKFNHEKPAEVSDWTDRDTLPSWAEKKDVQSLKEYRVKNNTRSLDGLPGLRGARRDHQEWLGVAEMRIWALRVLVSQKASILVGMMLMWCILLLSKKTFDFEMA
jgi:hypothetical protein